MSTHNIPFSIQKRKIALTISLSLSLWVFSKGLKNEFETDVVDEPSVFEPLKFYCTLFYLIYIFRYIVNHISKRQEK